MKKIDYNKDGLNLAVLFLEKLEKLTDVTPTVPKKANVSVPVKNVLSNAIVKTINADKSVFSPTLPKRTKVGRQDSTLTLRAIGSCMCTRLTSLSE